MTSAESGLPFRPDEYEAAAALLVEPHGFANGVVVADVSVFADWRELEAGTPSEVVKSSTVTDAMLVAPLEGILGSAMVGVVRKVPTASGGSYVFRDVDSVAEARVCAYYESRGPVRR
jgi:hypothetical protein